MNNFSAIGRLVTEPETRMSQSGTLICTFRIAISRPFKNRDGEYESDFLNCFAYGKTAEFVEGHFNKGQKIGVVGRVQSSTYEKNGEKRHAVDIAVNMVDMVESKKRDSDPFAGYSETPFD